MSNWEVANSMRYCIEWHALLHMAGAQQPVVHGGASPPPPPRGGAVAWAFKLSDPSRCPFELHSVLVAACRSILNVGRPGSGAPRPRLAAWTGFSGRKATIQAG